MKSGLTGPQRATFDAIFQHPVSRNLDWLDVRSMLSALADVAAEQNGNLKVTRNGYTLNVTKPRDKGVGQVQALMDIRHFLERSETASPQPAEEGKHLMVVIDHREARVYKTELHGSVPQRITPHDPGGCGRHLHYVQDDSNGQRKPERKSFYDAVAKTLQGAEQILMFGSSTGASSAMNQLIAELQRHHKDLARRIVGSLTVDEKHLTEDQLLAKAREFYASMPMQQKKSRQGDA
jgi:hypothetical protein